MTENKPDTELISRTTEFVRNQLHGAEGGHDWWHVYRVLKIARQIAIEERADMLVVELAALLHDIADPKFHHGDEEKGPEMASHFLRQQKVDEKIISHVEAIIRNMSFKNSLGEVKFYSKEMAVVQDADRLDAIGAIGIARAFNYGGFKNRPLFDPEIKPKTNLTKDDYKKSDAPTINHFYEKLLLLKDKMNTATAKRLAFDRHKYMEAFLDQFYSEWEGLR